MNIELNKNTYTQITDGPAKVVFNGDVLLSNSSTSNTYDLVYNEGAEYDYRGSKPLYAKARNSDQASVDVMNYSNVGSGAIVQEIPDVTPATIGDFYSFNIAANDFVTTRRSSNGQQFVEISVDPLTEDTQTIVEYKNSFKMPMFFEIEASISQRTKGDYPIIEITDKDTTGIDLPTEFNIVSCSQTTTTLTINIDNPFDGWLGSWVDVYGLLDNRFNYTNLAVASISTDKKTLTFSYSDETALPSLTATPASIVGGKVKRQAKLMAATNAIGMRFSGTSTTYASYVGRFGGGSIKEGGTLSGSRLVTNGSSATSITTATNGQGEIKASSRYRFELNPDSASFLDTGVENFSSVYATRIKFSATKPNLNNDYYLRFRAVSPKSMSKPIARVVTASKTGTTTTTITTDVPHGLNADSYVTVKGIRDVTNFASLTTATKVASIISPTQFTIVMGTATTNTSHGGSVILCNGQVDQQGVATMYITSVARDVNGFVTITGSANWSGVSLLEYVNIHGVLDAATGADLGFDGVYVVHNISTSTMVLEPVKNLDGSLVLNGSGVPVTPTGGVVTTTSCGGIVINRTTMRSFDIVMGTYSEQVTKIDGQGTNRADKAIPVAMTGSVTVTPGTLGTSGTGGLFVNPANTGITDVTSAALTSTNTGSSIGNQHGNGFQVTIPVTAVSGTNPTLDIRIEESFDGGTNWVTLYEMQRITATGSYNTPILRATGKHIRYVRTVSGTSPSFTHGITRNVLPLIQAEPQKRLMDRSIVLTTLNSVTPILFQGAANNVQLVVNIGAATTAPVLQLEGSEDGTNWYAMGAPLTAVASSTVQLTVSGLSATYTRARVSTAGATVTAGYVSIKAWS